SRLRPKHYIIRNLDVAAFARLSCDAARYQGRGGYSFPSGHQPTDRSRLGIHTTPGRVSGLAVLRGRNLRREKPMVDRNARSRGIFTAHELADATGNSAERCGSLSTKCRRLRPFYRWKSA